MSRLILYAGPNGAGKSTLRDIGNDRVEIVIDPDRIARELSSMAPDAAAIEAGRLAIQLFRDAVTQGKTLSLESTLSGKRILNRLAAARRAEYVIELRYVALLSADLHIQRVAQRVRKSGHDIPAETIIRRYDQSLENLPKAISLSDRVVVIDNSGPKRQFCSGLKMAGFWNSRRNFPLGFPADGRLLSRRWAAGPNSLHLRGGEGDYMMGEKRSRHGTACTET